MALDICDNLCLNFLSVKQILRMITLLMSFLLWHCMVLLILSSLLNILHGGGFLCVTEPFTEFHTLKHYKISLLPDTEIL